MSKKKAIKLAAASAVAASAFVAAAPAQTDAASNVAVEVSKAVTQMKKAYHTYSDVTANGEFAPIADVYKEYNAAKAAYKNAKALVTKAGGEHKEAYLAQLDATYNEYIGKRVVTYIDAYNYATALEDKKEALEAALENKEWDEAEALYHEISYELKTRTVILHRVYGQTARELLVDAFKLEAQDTRDSITNEVSVKMYFDKAEDLVADGKLEDAKKAMDHVADYVAKLDKDTDFGAALLTKVSEVKAAYEAKLAPAVESVSAINGTQLLVKFNKVVNQASAQTPGNYTINGAAVPGGALTTYELQEDKKSVLITVPVANKFANDSSFLVVVDGVKTVDAKDVAKYTNAVSFADHAAPTLGGVTYPSNTTAKIAFSEGMTALAGSAVKVYDGNTEVTGAGLQSVNGIANNGDKEIVIDLANAEVNKTYTVKVFGALDLYGNFAGTQTFTVVRTNADTVKPTVESVEAISLDTFKINFSERVSVDPGTPANGYGDISVGSFTGKLLTGSTGVTTVTPSTDGKSLTVVLGTPATAGLNSVKVDNFFDASGNKQESEFIKVINFAVDTKAPAVTKTEVIGDDLYVTFDDSDIALGATATDLINITRVDNNIEYPVANFGAAALHDADGNGKTDTIKISLAGKDKGVYSATLAAGVVQDKAATPNGNVAKSISFSYNAATSTAKPKVSDDNDTTNGISTGFTGQSIAKPNEIVLTFDKPVSSATALNLNNYLVDGVAVFEKAIFVGDDKTVRLTLKQDAIAVTATRAFTVQNVTSTAGVAMDTITFAQPFTENVAPTLKSARLLSSTEIEVKFTEAVADTTLETGAVKDFEVYVGGVKREEIPATVSVAGSGDTYVITLQAGNALTAEDLAKEIQVKLLSTTDATDTSAINNAAKGDVSVTVAK
ncbi:hypothetical protein BK139_12970 [Paenibacillus sp. FSL R5-0490]|uniref:hypothetical protein n=1 Tax=Paenibacillus sp. FSL R5-0490 TaxID=1920424 RepID=UPI00096ECED3|nr:hypothetical protein [Paenibacillus sp. FSL R5-0490]OMF59312.1 hypothetical protein BK139_12970 [Paenibacillus sp. FSL R5-0490]